MPVNSGFIHDNPTLAQGALVLQSSCCSAMVLTCSAGDVNTGDTAVSGFMSRLADVRKQLPGTGRVGLL